MKRVQYYSVHNFLQTFNTLEDVPILPEDKRAYDAADEDGIDVNSDLRMDFLDKAEVMSSLMSESYFQPHVEAPTPESPTPESPTPKPDEPTPEK